MRRWLVWCASLLLLAGACGETQDEIPTTVPGDEATTAAPTAAPPTTTPPTTAPPTTAPRTDGRPIEEVVAEAQRLLDAEFAALPDPPEGFTGPVLINCSDTGTVRRGDVFVCRAVPQTEPGFEVDAGSMVFAVLNDEGLVSWAMGTDMPGTTARLMDVYEDAPKGLLCRDLLDPATPGLGVLFSAYSTTPQLGYFGSLIYWFLEGQPDRMDEDGNGIPCETLYAPDVVAGVWDGGPTGWPTGW
jgi:hypothetical protein